MKLKKIWQPLLTLSIITPIILGMTSCGSNNGLSNGDPTTAKGFSGFQAKVSKDSDNVKNLANNVFNIVTHPKHSLNPKEVKHTEVYKATPKSWKMKANNPEFRNQPYNSPVTPNQLVITKPLIFDKKTSTFNISVIDMWDVAFPQYSPRNNSKGLITEMNLVMSFNAKTDSGKTYNAFNWIDNYAQKTNPSINDWTVFKNYTKWEANSTTLIKASNNTKSVNIKSLNIADNNIETLNYVLDKTNHSVTKTIVVFGSEPKQVTLKATWTKTDNKTFASPNWVATKVAPLNTTNNTLNFYQSATQEKLVNIITKETINNNKITNLPATFSTNKNTQMVQLGLPVRQITKTITNSQVIEYCALTYNLMFYTEQDPKNKLTNFTCAISIKQDSTNQKYQISDWKLSNFKSINATTYKNDWKTNADNISNLAKFGNNFKQYTKSGSSGTYGSNTTFNLWHYNYNKTDQIKQLAVSNWVLIPNPQTKPVFNQQPYGSFTYDDITLHLLFTITFNNVTNSASDFILSSITHD